MQVDEHRTSGCLGVPVGHADDSTFVQSEDVAEPLGKIREEGQFVGARVTEDRGESLAFQKFVGDVAHGGHGRSFPGVMCDTLGRPRHEHQ